VKCESLEKILFGLSARLNDADTWDVVKGDK